jgi:hypothetical protein
MSLLAIVLAPFVLATAPPAPLPPLAPPPPVVWRLAPKSCSDIDPGIVHYVAPPPGRGPVWLIELPPRPGPSFNARDLGFGPALKERGARTLPRLPCPRLMPAGDGR